MSASVTACHDDGPRGSGAAGVSIFGAGGSFAGDGCGGCRKTGCRKTGCRQTGCRRRLRFGRGRGRRGRSGRAGCRRWSRHRGRRIHGRIRCGGRVRSGGSRRRGLHGRCDTRACADTAARFGEEPDGRPRREDHREPAFAGASGEPLLRVPAEHPDPGDGARRADEQQRQQAEAHGRQSGPGDARLQRLDGVAAGKKRRDVLRPFRQARDRNRDPADDEHGQEDALAERLHRGHVVGHHRHHEPQADKREGDEGEGHPQIERVPRHRHAQRHREGQLQQPGADERDVAGRHRAGDQRLRWRPGPAGSAARRPAPARSPSSSAGRSRRRRAPSRSAARPCAAPAGRSRTGRAAGRRRGRSAETDSRRAAPSCFENGAGG